MTESETYVRTVGVCVRYFTVLVPIELWYEVYTTYDSYFVLDGVQIRAQKGRSSNVTALPYVHIFCELFAVFL